MPDRLRHLLAVVLLALLPCVLFPGALPGPRVISADDHLSVHHVFRTADGPGGSVANSELSDPAIQFGPLRARVLASWRAGHVPLWNPDVYGGAPLLADAQSGAFNPLVLLDLPLPSPTAQDLRSWLILVGSGLGTLLLAEVLGASLAGATLAGVVAMLSAFPVGWLLHPHAMAYAWVPWVAWSVARIRRGGGPLALALCVAGLLTAGHPETAFHCGLLVLGVALGTVRGRRAVSTLLLGGAVGVALSSPAWLPFLQGALSSATVQSHGGNHLPWRALVTLAWPDPFGHPVRGTWNGPPSHLETNLHVGIVALGLALWGARRVQARWWVAGAMLALAVALGLPLLAWVPANHARLGAMAGLALAVAAGLAVPWRRGAWILVFLAAGELLWARRSDQGTIPAEAFQPAPAAWARDLAQRTGDGRVVGLGWAVQPDTAMYAGLRDLRGYDLPVSKDTERLMRSLDPRVQRPWFPISALTAANRPVLRFAAVRTVLAVEADDRAMDSITGLQSVDLPDAPLRVATLDPDTPRAWIATACRMVRTPQEGLAALALPDARERPPVEANLVLGAASPIVPVAVREPWPERVEVDVSPSSAALLVLADAWADGWEVRVDGVSRPLLRTGGAFRGVALQPGDRAVAFTYGPWGWRWGRWIGLVGLLSLVPLAFWGRRPT